MAGGRPSKKTDSIVRKLEEATALDASIPEVCFYAGISKDTYYRWIKDDPKLSDRLKALRNKPVLKAREAIIKNLDDPNVSKWYLEKKMKKEFGQQMEQNNTNLFLIEKALINIADGKDEPKVIEGTVQQTGIGTDKANGKNALQEREQRTIDIDQDSVFDLRSDIQEILSEKLPDGTHKIRQEPSSSVSDPD